MKRTRATGRDSWQQRLLRSIDRSGECWEWTASKGRDGYGQIRAYGKKWRAHRLSFFYYTGILPPVDLAVCHHCDNRACVNPAHLYLGTHKDNARDKIVRGRANSPKGERNGISKLTAAKVVAIRERAAAGERHKEVAADYGVVPSLVSKIVHRRVWTWL